MEFRGMGMDDRAFVRLVEMIRSDYGIDLRKKRTLVEGRLAKVLSDRGFDNLEAYLDSVSRDKDGDELAQLLNKLTTNHTYFMREAEHFHHLSTQVLPQLAAMAQDHDIRVWSAGCSTGQEAYTLYMLLDEYFATQPGHWDHSVLATDISLRALDIAREGRYDHEELVELPAQWKKKYMKDLGDGTSRFSDRVREGVIFRPFNLMEEVFPFRRAFHVIFCRNVMIYFEQETKMRLVRRFHQHTLPGGYLYIGQTESVARGITGYRYVIPAVYRKEG
jgi:chemotaxis protein methyltransferase CheR